ncbi:MAG: hypothetical protein Q4C66_06200 [Lachnospiraceae bacterium]|nr:hypothetical protein [Lachnospiraceae bacterium]
MDRTRISENNMSFLEGKERSPRELVAFLKKGALYRSFDQVLSRACPDEKMMEKLIQGMIEITGEKPDSVARKVRNWLKGKNIPKNRKTLFQICFALGLNEAETGRVLGAAAETGIHYRNPDELVYAFALRTGKDYQYAEDLRKNVQNQYGFMWSSRDEESEEETDKAVGKKKAKKNNRENYVKLEPVFTRQIWNEFSQVTDEASLMEFFQEHGKDLGVLHETAYQKFMELMDYLQQPEGLNGKAEEKYTMDEIMDTYFQMHIPEGRKTADYTCLQKLVRKYWPNETSLLNMRNRKEDVSRKVMVLLYLVTEEFDFCRMNEQGMDEQKDYYMDDEEEDADTVLERRIKQMNLFLKAYGMNPLDPGNLFDYLVLYAMKARDGEPVSERMEQVLEILFEEEEKQ